MFKFIKSIFIKEPGSKIRKSINKKHAEAMQLQRNGKLREYAEVMKEIDELESKYENVINESR